MLLSWLAAQVTLGCLFVLLVVMIHGGYGTLVPYKSLDTLWIRLYCRSCYRQQTSRARLIHTEVNCVLPGRGEFCAAALLPVDMYVWGNCAAAGLELHIMLALNVGLIISYGWFLMFGGWAISVNPQMEAETVAESETTEKEDDGKKNK